MATTEQATEKHYGSAKLMPDDLEGIRALATEHKASILELLAVGRRVLEATPKKKIAQAIRDLRIAKVVQSS